MAKGNPHATNAAAELHMALEYTEAHLNHLQPVSLQPRPLSVASGISVNASHHTGNGRSRSVEAHGVGHISPNDHEGLALMGEQLGLVAHPSQQAVLPSQFGIDLQHQVTTVLLPLARVRWEAVICSEHAPVSNSRHGTNMVNAKS